jgi:hypothetical protein
MILPNFGSTTLRPLVDVTNNRFRFLPRTRTPMLAQNQINNQMNALPPAKNSDRRRFLLAAAAIASTTVTGTLVNAAEKPGSVMLRPASKEVLFRVRVEMEVEGNVDVPKNALVSRESVKQLPIQSTATLDYEERYRRGEGMVKTARRYYHEARTQGTLNRNEIQSELRTSVRDTVVRRDGAVEVIYSGEDYFTREELDVLRLPTSSLGLDDLLPTTAVDQGSKYSPTADAMRSVLALSSVEATDVVAEVVEIDATTAKIHFTGKVDGSYEGVPTVVRTVGKLTFDRTIGACTWLAMAVHETREIGKAEPGFDVSATIKMLRKPMDKPARLAGRAGEIPADGPIPEDRLYVDLRSDELGVSVLMDRRWRIMMDVPGAAMMRMIDTDRSIAQCDFRPLASLKPGVQWTMEAFEQDVKKTLGGQLTSIDLADQRASETGLRVMQVVASGAVQEVPIRWVLLHFSDDSGRRMLATFTMESANVATFAGADMQMAGSLQLIQPNKSANDSVTALRGTKRETRIKAPKSNENRNAEVQSASDLR